MDSVRTIIPRAAAEKTAELPLIPQRALVTAAVAAAGDGSDDRAPLLLNVYAVPRMGIAAYLALVKVLLGRRAAEVNGAVISRIAIEVRTGGSSELIASCCSLFSPLEVIQLDHIELDSNTLTYSIEILKKKRMAIVHSSLLPHSKP